MDLWYKSTRDSKERVRASEAVLTGLAPDGGLYVPETVPEFTVPLKDLTDARYQDVAYEVMRLFLTDYTEAELKDCIEKAYDSKFDVPEIAPVVKVGYVYHLELFHGATIAFKDMALSILPYLMTTAARKNQVENEIVILTATSGDTGKAALAGFADVPGTRIIVFYPKDGVSKIQERQMVTQKGGNVDVVALHGNFDSAQNGVKAMYTDQALKEELAADGYQFSSANSINIGRLVPQIVYYFWAYIQMLSRGQIEDGEEINLVVPTGNFGNILAAYYAKRMGLPVKKLLCASNENKVLYDFFTTGIYDKNRDFILTISPSMDILISSNLERLIYEIAGEDARITRELMEELSRTGRYTITQEMRDQLDCFVGGFATETQTKEQIREVYQRTGYIMDPHTAVASFVCKQYRVDTNDPAKCVIASTASPYKFVGSVMSAIDSSCENVDEFTLLKEFPKLSHTPMPPAIRDILDAEVLHHRECDPGQMKATVEDILHL